MKVKTPARHATADAEREARRCSKSNGHIFMNQNPTCVCGQMARENKYCASCRVEHVHFK